MNIWLIIRTSFTNGYVLFDSAMVLLSLLSVDVDTVVIVDVVAPYKQFTALLEKKTASWFQDDVIENVDSVYPVFNMTLSKRYRQK